MAVEKPKMSKMFDDSKLEYVYFALVAGELWPPWILLNPIIQGGQSYPKMPTIAGVTLAGR